MPRYCITQDLEHPNSAISALAPPLTKQQSLIRPSSLAPFYHNPAKQKYLLYSSTLLSSPYNPPGQEDPLHSSTLFPFSSKRSKQEDLLHSTFYRPPKAIQEHYIPLILNLLLSSQVCSTYNLKLDPQHYPKPAIYYIFLEDIYSKFTLNQGYTLVQFYQEVCTFNKDSFKAFLQPKQLKLSYKVCLLVFKSNIARLLLLLWNKKKECNSLEEAVVRQVPILLVYIY